MEAPSPQTTSIGMQPALGSLPGPRFFFGAVLSTALVAVPRGARNRIAAAGAGSGYLGVLAVGCPVCNKLVVALLGVSGAFNYFAPIQPLLGAAGLAMAGVALFIRLRGARRACSIPPRAEGPPLGV